MRIRRFAVSIAALAMTATMVGAPAAAQDESTLRVARLADHFNFFHPVQFQTGNQFQWWSNIFNTLVKVDSDSKTVVPDLAESWSVSPDATEFTFNLVQNATWHDGEPFTADDVRFSIEWYQANPNSYQGFSPDWDKVASIETPDDYTVVLTLDAPNAEFLNGLTDMANVIIPEHALAGSTADDVESLPFTLGTPGVTVGTGAYMLESFTPDQLVELKANPDYFKGAPAIDNIVFKLFADPALAIGQLESGELDLAFRVPPAEFDRLAAVDGLDVISAPNPGIVRIVFATEKSPWNDVNVRRAFAHAINKAGLVDGFYQGRAQTLHNHPGFEVYDDIDLYSYDPEGAAALLTEAGYANEPFKLLYDSTFPDAQAVMPLIQSDLQAVGLNVELVPTTGAEEFVDKLFATETDADGNVFRPEWDGFMHIGGSEALSPDITETYYGAATEDRPIWLSGYDNPRIFELWAAGRATAVPEERDEIYHELALILNQDLPMLHLYTPDLVMAASDSLGGTFDIHLNERETFMDSHGWTIDS